jgi:HD domain
MKRLQLQAENLSLYLRPETDQEAQLFELPDFCKGLLWGEPRFGHPEGKVGYHVREVLDNIELIPNLAPTVRLQLRMIALLHDTFKYMEDRSAPRDWSKHHGVIARRFLEQYSDDKVVLDILETHDDAYYAWLYERRKDEALRHKQLDNLLDRMGYCLQVYYLFFKCDTQTGDKTQASVKWFEQQVSQIELIDIPRY